MAPCSKEMRSCEAAALATGESPVAAEQCCRWRQVGGKGRNVEDCCPWRRVGWNGRKMEDS